MCPPKYDNYAISLLLLPRKAQDACKELDQIPPQFMMTKWMILERKNTGQNVLL